MYPKLRIKGSNKNDGFTFSGIIDDPCQNSGVLTANIKAIENTSVTDRLKIKP